MAIAAIRSLDAAAVEGAAPDQASLKAASKLTSAARWPRLEGAADGTLLWGECQGSGANPYRATVDLRDLGAKCTCPSRKFPCKHSLALMWMFAENAEAFSEADVPYWVTEWLSRRRGPSAPGSAASGPAAGAAQGGGAGAKSLAAATRADESADPEAAERARKRSEAAESKRAADTAKALDAAMDELDGWVADRLRLGLIAFVDEATDRCRAIAARMVDMKAGALASRIDEMPSRLLALRPEERPRRAMMELGALALITASHRAAPDDPDVRRAVRGGPTRDEVMNDLAAPRVRGLWEVVGERVSTRRDGLVSQSTWLMERDAEAPRFALLLDHTPASAGRRASAFQPGEMLRAELAFHPSRAPLCAVIAEREPLPDDAAKPADAMPWAGAAGGSDPLEAFARHVARDPLALEAPVVLGPGNFRRDAAGKDWWSAAVDGDSGEVVDRSPIALPLEDPLPDAALGMPAEGVVGLWDGTRLHALCARGPWGRMAL